MNKKTITISLLGLFVILLLSSIAQAEVEVNGLSDGKVVLNVDYSDLDDDSDDTMEITKTLTFENTEELCPTDCDLECESECTDCPECTDCIDCHSICDSCIDTSKTVSLELTETVNLPEEYELFVWDSETEEWVSEISFDLSPEESKTVTLKVVVPIDEDSGEHDIGDLSWTVDGTETVLDIVTEVKSMLELKEIKVYANQDKIDTVGDDGEKISKVKPGSEIELQFEVKNLFKDDEYDDGEMEVDLTVTLEDSDFDDDVDESEEFDIRADEKLEDEDVVIVFDVPREAKEEEYDLKIRLEGEDGNGAVHVVEWTVILDVDRDRDDVQIETAKLVSETLSCGETTYLKIKMTNFGSNRQDDAALSVYSKELNLDFNEMNIELEDGSDEDYEYSKSIFINPGKDAAPGIYYIDVRAYINDDEQVDDELVRLTVNACELTTTEDDTTDDSSDDSGSAGNDVVVNYMPDDSIDLSSPTADTTLVTAETSFSDVKGAVVLMSVIVGLLVILIVLSIAILVKK